MGHVDLGWHDVLYQFMLFCMSRFLYDILYLTRVFSEIISSFILRAFCCEWFSEFALQLPSHVVKLASKSEETGGAVAERESASAQAGVAKHRRDGHIRQRTQRTWRSSQWLPEQERKSFRRERRLLYSVIAPFRCFVCSIMQYFFALFFDIVQCIQIFLNRRRFCQLIYLLLMHFRKVS